MYDRKDQYKNNSEIVFRGGFVQAEREKIGEEFCERLQGETFRRR